MMKRKRMSGAKICIAALVAGAGLAAAPSLAMAQGNFNRGGNVGVLERAHPDYDPLGIHAGAFTIYPRVSIDLDYDDNAFANAAGAAVDDTVLTVRPSVRANSNWSRHSLSLSADAIYSNYSSNSAANSTQWSVAASGRLEAYHDLNFNGSLGYSRRQDPRYSPGYTDPTTGATNTIDPILFDVSTIGVGGAKEFNHLRFSGRFGLTEFDYDDVTITSGPLAGTQRDEDFRDRKEYRESLRADYAVSPDTALFFETSASQQRPDDPTRRDTQTVNALAGVNFEITQLITGEVGVGLSHHSFENPATLPLHFGAYNNFNYRVQVQWFPTQLVTLTFDAQQDVIGSALVNSTNYVSDDLSVQVDYELMRNFIVTGRLNTSYNDYQNLDRNDRFYGASLSGTYLVNRGVGVRFNYSYFKRTSESGLGVTPGSDYDDNTIGVALVLQR